MNESLTLSQAISDFHFLRPLWLLALLPALFFFRRLWRLDAQGSAWHKVIDQNLLPYLLSAGKNASQRLPLYLLLGVWTLSIVALAGPTWSKQTQPVQQRQDALVIVLDLSLGMFANDFDPNRITVARRKIMDILDMRREGQTALVVYAGEAHMVTPLTDDSVSIRAMVPALSPNIMPIIGNNPAQAIQMARTLMDEASAVNGRVLLITGGFGPDQNSAIQDVLSDGRYPLHIIGIGSAQGAPIPAANGEFLRDTAGQMVVASMDRGNLNALASQLNGRYQDVSIDSSDLESVLAESLMGNADDYLEADEQVELWYDAGPWLLLLLVPLCALCFRRGWILQIAVVGGALLLALPTQPVIAQPANTPIPLSDMPLEEMAIGSQSSAMQPPPPRGFRLSDLWRNRDQRGLQAMEENDPASAATLFEDSAWRGTANYRAGNYDAAVREFSLRDDLDSKFNLGNALAFSERFEEAIAAYQSVLDVQPDHADALKNKAIVEELLQEQQQQEQEQQQQEQQEQEEQQQSESESESDDSQQQQQQEQQQEQQDQQQQQESEQQPPSEQEQESESDNANSQQRANTEIEEDQESLEQFLRRIEDDPGELLQRKFQFESRRRMIERRAASQGVR